MNSLRTNYEQMRTKFEKLQADVTMLLARLGASAADKHMEVQPGDEKASQDKMHDTQGGVMLKVSEDRRERKGLYPHLTPSRLTLTKFIGEVTEVQGPKMLTAYLAHRRSIHSVIKEMRKRRTFDQRMGRSKTQLVDLCSPSNPLFFMPMLEEVGSVDYLLKGMIDIMGRLLDCF